MAKVMSDNNNDPPPKASRLSLFSPSGKLPGAGDQDELSQLRGTFLSRRPNSLGAELPGGGRGRGRGRGPGRGLVKAESYRIGRRHSAEIGSLSSSTNSVNRRSSDPEYGELYYMLCLRGSPSRVESLQSLSFIHISPLLQSNKSPSLKYSPSLCYAQHLIYKWQHPRYQIIKKYLHK